tara:strand:- start:743 stop:1051 length:309 start_codon:yes stop_codon:yes gene_type:complete
MAKKEKEIQVKQRAEKIHDKHLAQLQKLVNTINTIQFNVGKMEIQKMTALDEMKKNQQGVSQMQDILLKEYGSYDVNVNDGTINWPKDPSENGIDKPKKDEK